MKYYQENEDTVFAIINDKKYVQNEITNITVNQNAIEYYKEAYEFKEKLSKYPVLKDLDSSKAVDAKGENYSSYGENNPYPYRYKVFGELFNDSNKGPYIEDSNSQFNNHKLQVIKNSIESNLIPAISNYNKISTSGVNFAMPKLQEYEWEQITQNVSMLTFLQGLNIGGKIYNGYSIISNNNNEEYVAEDSIYILNKGEYHKVTDSDLLDNINDQTIGLLNINFDRRATTANLKVEDTEYSRSVYYYPREEKACYNSIINANGTEPKVNVYEYLKEAGTSGLTSAKYKLAQIYYTALGRERYGMYRVTNKLEDIQEYLKK
ncbi:MAG: hypothetical protein HFJ37_01855 [Clostridia bacterium]|nr:hypothetical protein [Clostridia bacterium]